MNAKSISIYTDGSCINNPGPGGWAAVMILNDHITLKHGFKKLSDSIFSKHLEHRFDISNLYYLSGNENDTTNNKMEMLSCIMAFNAFDNPINIDIYTDSNYVKNGITSWIKKWQVNGWKNAQKKPVQNQELWLQLQNAISKHYIEWHWIKGHSGVSYNEIADHIANYEARHETIISHVRRR